ncbi:hypothetical protein OHA44_36645 [Streptomyces sp. NBC_00144]|uniref:hypothetical protein n=1 Tax=Streptomyces sp. NBC_00144 TaxID=2975665 RepID=UPI003249B69D
MSHTLFRGPRSLVLGFCLIAVAFALTQLLQVNGRESPDTRQYVAYSLMLSGQSREQAAAHTIDYYCESERIRHVQNARVDVASFMNPGHGGRAYRDCRKYEEDRVRAVTAQGGVSGYMSLFSTPRMSAIFATRPGYPALLVPYLAVLGLKWGLWAAAVTMTVAASALIVVLLRGLGMRPPAALVGQVLYYVLPVSEQTMRPMSEGLLLAAVMVVVLACVRLLHGHSPRMWLGIAAAGFALAALTKYSETLLIAGCLALVPAAMVVWRRLRGRRVPRRTLALTALCMGTAVAVQTTVQVLDLPSARESMQDLFAHFSRPDVPDPWHRLMILNGAFWVDWVREQCITPLTAALLGAGAWGVLRRGRALAGIMFAVTAAGLLNQAGHPDVGIGPRLAVLIWLLPVIGIPLLWAGYRQVEQLPGGAEGRQTHPQPVPVPNDIGALVRADPSGVPEVPRGVAGAGTDGSSARPGTRSRLRVLEVWGRLFVERSRGRIS